MTEDKTIWEKPPGCKIEWEKGQRGAYGYLVRIYGDNFDEAFAELTRAVGIMQNFEKGIREDTWKLKENPNGK